MTRLQWIVILASALLLAGLYFGFDTKPKDQKNIETKRAIEGTATDFATLENAAKSAIKPADLTRLDALAEKAAAEKDEKAKLALLKELAGGYFESGSPILSGKTADEIADPHNLRIQFRLNGETMQDSTTAELVFRIPEIISYLARSITLEIGDVIATGTPPGVGFARKPPVFMKQGDIAEVEIEGLGILKNPVTEG